MEDETVILFTSGDGRGKGSTCGWVKRELQDSDNESDKMSIGGWVKKELNDSNGEWEREQVEGQRKEMQGNVGRITTAKGKAERVGRSGNKFFDRKETLTPRAENEDCD